MSDLQDIPPLDLVGEPDEKYLVAQAQNGNQAAFEELYLCYNKRICLYLTRMVGNDGIGSELAQDTFLKAWQSLPRLRDLSRFASWLYRIATNNAYDYQRRAKLVHFVRWDEHRESEEMYPKLSQEEQIEETELLKMALARVSLTNRPCLISPADCESLDRHVKSCSACAAAQADYSYLDARLRALPPPAVRPLPRLSFQIQQLEQKQSPAEDGANTRRRPTHSHVHIRRKTSQPAHSFRRVINASLSWLVAASIIFAALVLFHSSYRTKPGSTTAHPGVITEFLLPSTCRSSSCRPDSIVAGPDGNLWFTEDYGSKIGRITSGER
jgi:RNA polymerase sigma-70 factor, ECF subfamily